MLYKNNRKCIKKVCITCAGYTSTVSRKHLSPFIYDSVPYLKKWLAYFLLKLSLNDV